MKIFIGIILLLTVCNCHKSSEDYMPVTEAHTTLEQIKKESDKFKDLIDANVTKDFNACVDLIKQNECNFMDQWQSEIEKCKLENDNSVNVEVPFIKERKAERVKRLKKLIELGDQYDAELLTLVEQLKIEQGDFQKSSWEIHQLYKLPEENQIQFVQKSKKQIDVVRALNANIPRVAEDEVRAAKGEYEHGDISIQAQTVSEEMLSGYRKLEQAMESLQQAYQLRQAEIQKEKDAIKLDIVRLRALMDNEVQVQTQNLARIEELQAKILICEPLPKNAAKDCGPIKIRASKMQTEMAILETRTELLFKEIDKLMNENQNLEQIGGFKDSFQTMKEGEQKRREEEAYLTEKEDPMVTVYTPPVELKPQHHLKEQVN